MYRKNTFGLWKIVAKKNTHFVFHANPCIERIHFKKVSSFWHYFLLILPCKNVFGTLEAQNFRLRRLPRLYLVQIRIQIAPQAILCVFFQYIWDFGFVFFQYIWGFGICILSIHKKNTSGKTLKKTMKGFRPVVFEINSPKVETFSNFSEKLAKPK